MQFERLHDEPILAQQEGSLPVLADKETVVHNNVDNNRKLSSIDLEGGNKERRSSLELGGMEGKDTPLIDREDKEAEVAIVVVDGKVEDGVKKEGEKEEPKTCMQKCKAWAKKLKRSIGIIMIALKNPDLPLLVKCIAWFTVIYALSPIDLIPDCIPILGYLDDLIIVPIGIWLTIKLIPKEIWDQAEDEYNRSERTKPKKDWRGAVIVVGIWLAFAAWIGKLIYERVHG
jgi:uncharacterized membrane protein YkvA (DUF1232 family)